MNDRVLGVVTALFLTILVIVAINQLEPPDSVSPDAPAETFSSGRALAHLEVIAARPHPTGSPENADVRDYILQELRNVGLQPEIQKTEVTRYRSARYARFATVQNIVARLNGRANSKALLLLSHYDSVPNAHGATDDGSGVVTMLETLRALKHHSPLKNDVIFLFTDGEELGLMGATAFVEQHPWAEDVGLVLNFEGSGSSGQVIMFETSKKSSWLVEEFAKAAPYPVANSLSYEIYKRMPNDTDLSIFKDAGFPGLNFAYVDNRYDYYTQSDNVENIDERSIQHHGSYALALTKHFGNLNLGDTTGSDSVYFNTFGTALVHYSQSWVIPIAILAFVGYFGVLTLGFRGHHLKVSGVAKGLAAFLLGLVSIPVIVTCLFRIVANFFEGADWWLLYYNNKLLLLAFSLIAVADFSLFLIWLRRGTTIVHAAAFGSGMLALLYFGDLLSLQFALVTVGLSFLIYFVLRRETTHWNLAMGGLLAWLVLTAGVSLAIPGASYLVVWPFLFSLVPVGIAFVKKDPEHSSVSTVALFCVFATPAVLWLSQVSYLILNAMGINLIGVAVLFVVLLFGLLVPHFCIMAPSNSRALPAIAGGLGVVFLLWATVGANFDERHRRPNMIFYGLNADSGKTIWGSTDLNVDDWTSKYLSENPTAATLADFLPTSSAKLLTSPAPRTAMSSPAIEVLEDKTNGEARTLRMHITSQRGAPYLNIFFQPTGKIVGAMVNGMQLDGLEEVDEGSSPNWWRWRYFALPTDGIDLILKINSLAEFEIKLTDVSYALPEIVGYEMKARPDHMMPARYTLSDMTVASKTFTFAASAALTNK